MPKRTNAFQELVAIIHNKLNTGWTVTESQFFTDSITAESREVDVVASAKVGGYELFISIECRDHGRPADVTWIESMAKKHEHLATSKLVLWSRSGFTKAALKKALALKIDTVSQASARQAEWATLARGLVGGHVKLVTPEFTPFIDTRRANDEPFRLENVSASNILDSQGDVIQTIPKILAFMAESTDLRTVLLDHAPEGAGDFYCEVTPPIPWHVDTPEGERLLVQRIGISVRTFVEKLALDAASAIVENRVATLASADATTGRFQFYLEEAPDGSKPIRIANIRKPA